MVFIVLEFYKNYVVGVYSFHDLNVREILKLKDAKFVCDCGLTV